MKTLIVTLILMSGSVWANTPTEKQKNTDPKENETRVGTKQKIEIDDKSMAFMNPSDLLNSSPNQMSAVKIEEFKSKKDENLPKVIEKETTNFGSSPILMIGNFDFSKKGSSVNVCCLPCPMQRPCE